VVGAGPAGLAFATTAAQRGFEVTLFDAAPEIGGQFNIAKQVPGKEEFYETLRYFGARSNSLASSCSSTPGRCAAELIKGRIRPCGAGHRCDTANAAHSWH
jgi:2,4-dienoyl-CoA reductase (NADPH2)